MEGLEVKIISFKGILLDNEKFRIDDEFFLKKYLKAYEIIKSKPYTQLKEIASVLTDFSANGSYATIAENFKLLDEEDYAYMVRTTDLEKRDYINDVKYVDRAAYEFLSKSKIYGGEVLINKIGNPGRVFLMPDLNIPVSLGMNLFLIRLKQTQGIKEKFLWAYLNTGLGQLVIKRKINGTVPLTIDKEAIRTLYIPIIDNEIQNKVVLLIDRSECFLREFKQKYSEAENLLLETLGLQDFTPSTEAVNVKTFKESFVTTGRLDAEYYQPKYEETVDRIKQNEWKLLNQIVDISKSIEPGSSAYDEEQGLPFFRVSDYNKFGLNTPAKNLSLSYIKENKVLLNDLKPKAGTILFSKDGSVGTAYLLTEDLHGVTSGATLHLKVKEEVKVLPEYLTLALNSKLVQLQAERDAGGSIILHWRLDEIENVVVPIVDYPIQQEVATLIQESFALKAQSENFLEVAKRAVEIAIEENEDAALRYINENS